MTAYIGALEIGDYEVNLRTSDDVLYTRDSGILLLYRLHYIVYIIIVLVVLLIAVIVTAVLCIIHKRRKIKKKRTIEEEAKRREEELLKDVDSLPVVTDVLVKHRLGEGHFGEVWYEFNSFICSFILLIC
jgi:large-conductance mechanosensitive channel